MTLKLLHIQHTHTHPSALLSAAHNNIISLPYTSIAWFPDSQDLYLHLQLLTWDKNTRYYSKFSSLLVFMRLKCLCFEGLGVWWLTPVIPRFWWWFLGQMLKDCYKFHSRLTKPTEWDCLTKEKKNPRSITFPYVPNSFMFCKHESSLICIC